MVAVWRDVILVSQVFTQTLLPNVISSPRAKPIEVPGSRFQLSVNSYSVCWQNAHFDLHEEARFRVRLFHTASANISDTTSVPIYTHHTSASCYLFRNLPNENCCRIGIAEVVGSRYSNGTSNLPETSDETVIDISSDYKPCGGLCNHNAANGKAIHDNRDKIV